MALRGALPLPARGRGRRASLAAALRETFADLAELERVLLFIDEVEEIAGIRSGGPPTPVTG